MESGQWTVGINLGSDIQVALPPAFLLEMVQTVKEESKENFGLVAQSVNRKEF
jgi:hypothetical protein